MAGRKSIAGFFQIDGFSAKYCQDLMNRKSALPAKFPYFYRLIFRKQ